MSCTGQLYCFLPDVETALVVLREWAAPFPGPHERISQPVGADGFDLRFDDEQVGVSLLPYPECVEIALFVTTVSAEQLAHLETCFDRAAAIPDVLRVQLSRDGTYRKLPRFFGTAWVVRALLDAATVETVLRDQGVLEQGFDRVERAQGRVLLVRAEGLVDRLTLRDALEESSWAMTRGLKPGQFRVNIGPLVKGDEAIHFRGTPALKPVGYLQEERCFEFSCVLSPKIPEIRGWELCRATEMLRSASFEGHPLERVRVVFLEFPHARAEMRPLLELGLEVWSYTDDGELCRLKD